MRLPEASRRCCSRRASARSMLSPPSRMWSPTATRFSVSSPFSSETIDQAEIRGAAAHVAHQDQVADLDSAAPGVTLAFKPRVKGCLRLFQQGDVLITGLFGGAPESTRVLLRRTKRAP